MGANGSSCLEAGLLLDQGRVTRAIEEAAGANVTHGRQITERAAREIKPVLAEVSMLLVASWELSGFPLQVASSIYQIGIARSDGGRYEAILCILFHSQKPASCDCLKS